MGEASETQTRSAGRMEGGPSSASLTGNAFERVWTRQLTSMCEGEDHHDTPDGDRPRAYRGYRRCDIVVHWQSCGSHVASALSALMPK